MNTKSWTEWNIDYCNDHEGQPLPTRLERKKRYKMYVEAMTLQCINPFANRVDITPIPKQQESDMQVTIEQEARDHLLRRLSGIHSEKSSEIIEHFHVYGYRPKNRQEAEKWLKEGFYWFHKGYKYDDEDGSDVDGTESYEGWEWGKKYDTEAYEKAREALRKEKQTTEDAIRVYGAEEGLKALQAFESKTFH